MRAALAALCAAIPLAAGAMETIVLDGSSGMVPLARSLAAAYKQHHPQARVEVGSGLGTGARLRALGEGKIQVALASHGVKPEDLEKGNLRTIDVAKGAIVFGVNSSVPVADISEAQVCEIYSGRALSWRSVGAPDQPIAAFTRPPAEVDPEVIRAKIGCFKGLKEADNVKVMARGPDMAKALAETPHALGMTSMTVVEQSGGKIKALALNGIAPTPQNVRDGRYILSRDFMFVVKAQPSAEVQHFLDFVLSPEGDRVIRENGAVPLR
jgi:phosphate transport system substrate-binding protein